MAVVRKGAERCDLFTFTDCAHCNYDGPPPLERRIVSNGINSKFAIIRGKFWKPESNKAVCKVKNRPLFGRNEGRKVAIDMLRQARGKMCPNGFAPGGEQRLSGCESQFTKDMQAAFSIGRAIARQASSSGVDGMPGYQDIFMSLAAPKVASAIDKFEGCLANDVCNCCESK